MFYINLWLPLYLRHNLSTENKELLVDYLKKENEKIVFDRHFYYFNFTNHKLHLNLINMVRKVFRKNKLFSSHISYIDPTK